MRSPIHFHPAPPRSTWRNALWTAAQCSLVWFLTLFLVPLLLITLERRVGGISWSSLHLPAAAVMLFLMFSMLNVLSGAALVVTGQGTPLPIAAPRQLVVRGPYRYVRNPMALAGIGQGIAVGLWFGSWIIIAYALTGALVWHFGIRPIEEQDLVARFGDDYLNYRAVVPLWLPRYTGYEPAVT